MKISQQLLRSIDVYIKSSEFPKIFSQPFRVFMKAVNYQFSITDDTKDVNKFYDSTYTGFQEMNLKEFLRFIKTPIKEKNADVMTFESYLRVKGCIDIMMLLYLYSTKPADVQRYTELPYPKFLIKNFEAGVPYYTKVWDIDTSTITDYSEFKNKIAIMRNYILKMAKVGEKI